MKINLQLSSNTLLICSDDEPSFFSGVVCYHSQAHEQPSSTASYLAPCLKLPPTPYIVWANSKGSGKTSQMTKVADEQAARDLLFALEISCLLI